MNAEYYRALAAEALDERTKYQKIYNQVSAVSGKYSSHHENLLKTIEHFNNGYKEGEQTIGGDLTVTMKTLSSNITEDMRYVMIRINEFISDYDRQYKRYVAKYYELKNIEINE